MSKDSVVPPDVGPAVNGAARHALAVRPTPAARHTAADRPARLSVGVVGTGRVGPVLAAALGRAGHRVVAASGVSKASRRRAAELLPGVPLVDPDDVLARADLALLAVPDDVLPGLVGGLAEVDAVRPGQLLVHPSGRHGTTVLEPATRRGALPLALHPAMTFTGSSVDLARLAGVSFGVTAPEPLRPIAESLVVEMGGEPLWVPEERRPLYHAALAFSANHLAALITTAADLLRAAGVDDPAPMLGPLLGVALDNALRHGDAALTGPVARGDAQTVATHIREVGQVSPQAQAAYVALARLTADRAMGAGMLDSQAIEALLDVLATRPDAATA